MQIFLQKKSFSTIPYKIPGRSGVLEKIMRLIEIGPVLTVFGSFGPFLVIWRIQDNPGHYQSRAWTSWTLQQRLIFEALDGEAVNFKKRKTAFARETTRETLKHRDYPYGELIVIFWKAALWYNCSFTAHKPEILSRRWNKL